MNLVEKKLNPKTDKYEQYTLPDKEIQMKFV